MFTYHATQRGDKIVVRMSSDVNFTINEDHTECTAYDTVFFIEDKIADIVHLLSLTNNTIEYAIELKEHKSFKKKLDAINVLFNLIDKGLRDSNAEMCDALDFINEL